MTQTSITTAGIDTSKAKLDIAVHGRTERWQVANTLSGWRVLAANLAKAGVTRVGIEATGGYERGVVEHLRAAGFTVPVLQPIQVKAFGRVHLRRAKNDTLDAELIAACTAAIDQPRIAPDPRLAELAESLTFLEQLEEVKLGAVAQLINHVRSEGRLYLHQLLNAGVPNAKLRFVYVSELRK